MRRTEQITKQKRREKRIFRIRQKVSGTAERPRLVVIRSLRHIYAQLIDDTANHTITQVSTLTPEVRAQLDGKNKTQQALLVGKTIAEKAKEKSIEAVVFDRRGLQFHGRIKAVADAARESGLKV